MSTDDHTFDDFNPPKPLPHQYVRQANFTTYESNNPENPKRGTDLDGEMDHIKRALDETQSRLRMLQADDGQMRGGVVRREALGEGIELGFTPPEEWEPGREYAATASVFFDRRFYTATARHVSSATFQEDLDADLWNLAVDFNAVAADAAAARDKAKLWAEESEDTEVEDGAFSSLHHAAKSGASASAASDSETAAAASASAASDSETAAAASASAASDSETAAAASASAASDSESNAADSESTAVSAANSAAAQFKSFQGIYYGALTSDPSLDPNGDPPAAGDWYFNTTNDEPRIFDGGSWGVIGASTASLQEFTLTEGQTTVSPDGGYSPGFVVVTLNGVQLAEDDYTADDGADIVLAEGAAAGDILSVLAFGTFDLANHYTIAETDDKFPAYTEFNGPTPAEIGRGAIVESGSNSNGHYVRWGNGEQVCWIEEVTFSGITTSDGELFHSDQIVWDYPADFVSEPANSGYIRAGTARAWAGIGNSANNDTDSMSVVAFRATSTTSDGSIKLIAWGFWK